jgi:hypothetical protein
VLNTLVTAFPFRTLSPLPYINGMRVLMAPHHGSSRIDGRALIRWCGPGLVISSQGPPRGDKAEAMYTLDDVEYWTTHARGAVTVRSRAAGLEAEAYHDGRAWRKR